MVAQLKDTFLVVELPNGERVHVRSLNALQRAQVQFHANLYAAERVRPWLAGQEHHPFLLSYFAEWPVEEQKHYLVEGLEEEEGSAEKGRQHFGPPPQRLEAEEEIAYAERVAAWKRERESQEQLRRRQQEEALAEARERFLAMTPQERLEACCRRWCQKHYRENFSMQFLLEALSWAVRYPDNPKRRRFPDVTEIADLDDDTLEILANAYLRVDGVLAEEVPTLPPLY